MPTIGKLGEEPLVSFAFGSGSALSSARPCSLPAFFGALVVAFFLAVTFFGPSEIFLAAGDFFLVDGVAFLLANVLPYS